MALGAMACAGVSAWGYASDSGLGFYGGWTGLAMVLAALAFASRGRTRSMLGVPASGLLCFVLLLLALELFSDVGRTPDEQGSIAPTFSYEAARGDPRAFRRWWTRYLAEWKRVRDAYLQPDPAGVHPWVPIPGSRGRFFESAVRINALGFRGPEPGRSGYRIFALGESTTFGATLRPADRPWPEVLQSLIRHELACRLPVEVVNAGVPGWDLRNSLDRLEHAILPLKPAMIISYHGYNGFKYITDAIPEEAVLRRPKASHRPSRLLGGAENALRSWWFARRHRRMLSIGDEIPESELLESEHARLYRRLVEITDAHDIRLVLCSFNMAVNGESPEAVVRFYEGAFPLTRLVVLASRQHSRLVREIARRSRAVAIDTSPGLDANHREAFIDLVHLTQWGRDRLARNILDGIRPILEADPALQCRSRDLVRNTG